MSRPEASSPDKPIMWLHGEVRSPPFSAQAHLEAGVLLRRLQRGETLGLPHSRPMPSIGRRCHELRVVDHDATWRIAYRLDADAVVIADVFKKMTRTTPRSVVQRCVARLRRYDELACDEG